MKGLNKKKFPFSLATEIEKLLLDTKRKSEEYSDILSVSYTNDEEILFTDNDPNSDYYLRILNPQSVNDTNLFHVECFPGSKGSFKVVRTDTTLEGVYIKLDIWIDLIVSYNRISYNEEAYFEKKYEDEFYDVFEIVDEDAEISPFGFQQQLLLDKFLEGIEIALEQNKEQYEVVELIVQTKKVRQEISSSTKKVLIKKISKIWAKIRLKGIQFTKEVFVDYCKDLGKNALASITEGITRALMKP